MQKELFLQQVTESPAYQVGVQVGKVDSTSGSVLSERRGLGWVTSHQDPCSVEPGVASVL